MTSEPPISGPISRRGFLTTAALSAGGLAVAGATRPRAALAAGRTIAARHVADTTACLTLSPTAEVGPFYVAYDRIRSHIRGGQSGVKLTLHVRVINVATCRPIHNAALDVWQANRLGVYSAEHQENTVGETWLRGLQLTDRHGRATFHTIMPGWYQGRVEHIHAKVRLHGAHSGGDYSGGTTAHVGQFFFPQKVNDRIARRPGYAANTQQRITNATDRVYTQQGGSQSVLALTGSPLKGYVGRITVGIEP